MPELNVSKICLSIMSILLIYCEFEVEDIDDCAVFLPLSEFKLFIYCLYFIMYRNSVYFNDFWNVIIANADFMETHIIRLFTLKESQIHL